MSKIHSIASVLLILTCLLTFTACGGGASDSEAPPAGAQPPLPSTSLSYDPATARALALQSMQMQDTAAAESALLQATSLAPTMIDGWLLLASVRLQSGDVDAAFEALDPIKQLGIRAPIDAYAPLQPLQSDPRWAELLAELDGHREPAGASDVLFTLSEKELLTEGVAYDPQADAWYVSAVHGRKIVRLGADGSTSDWLADRDDVWGVFGLAADPERRKLWAVTASVDQMRGFDPSAARRTALLELDLDSAEIVGRYELPAAEPPTEPQAGGPKPPSGHQLNDLAVAADGTVYVSDTLPPGGIYRLSPGGESLERIGEAMLTSNPQGIALVNDDSLLVIGDYSLGLLALDPTNGESWFIEPPEDLWLQAVDGVTSAGAESDGELLVIQNGAYPPHRILHLKLSDDYRRIESWKTAAQALPEWREPTLGTVVQDGTSRRFVYVAASQWARFPPGSEPDPTQLVEPTIMSLEF